VAVVQISRIQHRRGLATDLPQLAAGELGWVIDEQKLYIGNGTVADGAPAVGNTEVLTSGSSIFTAATGYTYKGYLGDATPIVTGNGVSITRTLQERLDDTVSVKAFGAQGDASTDDTAAIQRALDELYTNTDKTDARSRRILFFPAGQYNITSSITIPPYAHLTGEGADRTIIYYSGSAAPVAKTQDNLGNEFGSMSAVAQNINIEQITFKNGTAHTGFSVDCAKDVRFMRCKFQGTYAAGGIDVANSKGVTVRSTNALPCSNIIFDACIFTKFARLVDFDYDLTSAKFINSDFSVGYYGAYIGDDTDGASNGLTQGPSNVQFIASTWSTIGQNAIRVDAEGTIRNIISAGNWYASDIGNNFEDYDTNDYNDIVPVLAFTADECASRFDYFERADLRSTSIAPSRDVDGVAVVEKPVKQKTLADNTSNTTTDIRVKATNGSALIIKYKIERGSNFRTGTLTVIGKGGGLPSFSDDYEETGDVGVTLTVTASELDSTVIGDNETFTVLYTTDDQSGTAATFDYQITEIV
jgi:hypothetical protein